MSLVNNAQNPLESIETCFSIKKQNKTKQTIAKRAQTHNFLFIN